MKLQTFIDKEVLLQYETNIYMRLSADKRRKKTLKLMSETLWQPHHILLVLNESDNNVKKFPHTIANWRNRKLIK